MVKENFLLPSFRTKWGKTGVRPSILRFPALELIVVRGLPIELRRIEGLTHNRCVLKLGDSERPPASLAFMEEREGLFF